jgi:hypothetical protein
MGLYLTRLVLAENGGMLTLRSGDAHVMCTPSSVSSVGAPWIPGTLVVARIRTDGPFDYGRIDEALSRAGGVRT